MVRLNWYYHLSITNLNSILNLIKLGEMILYLGTKWIIFKWKNAHSALSSGYKSLYLTNRYILLKYEYKRFYDNTINH